MIGWVLFAVGGIVCVVNGYLSWLRYPLHRFKGGTMESYRWVSGIPLAGTALVLGAWGVWLRSLESVWLNVAAGLLIVADAGGPHWFAVQLLRRRPPAP